MVGDVFSKFSDALAEHGLIIAPHEIVADGEIHRFASPGDHGKPCWYILHPDGMVAGSFGCWKRLIKADWCEKDLKELPESERAALIARTEHVKAQRKAYMRQEQKAAQIKAQALWDGASSEVDEHAYLRKKSVLAHGIRSDGLNLIIPLRDVKGTLHSVQTINPKGEKLFFTGGRMSGCFFLIGTVRDVIYLCEGYSTGATIHELTGSTVAVAFNCNNLKPVAKTLKKRYPGLDIIIAADNDAHHENGKNPGLESASAAAQALGLTMVVPQFSTQKGNPSDFNDMRRLEGDCATLKALLKSTVSHVLNLGNIMAEHIERKDCLLHPWLPAQGICMMHAPRGIGKTWFSLYVAYAVSHGYGFLNWTVKRPRRVLYIDGEMPAFTLQDRFKAILNSYENKINGKLRIITPDFQPNGMFDLSSPQDQRRIAVLFEYPELIIVDNLSCLARTFSDSDQESWTEIQKWALHQRAMGRSVLFVHHSGKSGQQRGTSRREDTLDTVIKLKLPAGYNPSDGCKFEVHFEKSRGFYGKEAQSFEASLINDEQGRQHWVTKTLEQSIDDQLLAMKEEGISTTEMASILGIHRSTVFRRLKALRNR